MAGASTMVTAVARPQRRPSVSHAGMVVAALLCLCALTGVVVVAEGSYLCLPVAAWQPCTPVLCAMCGAAQWVGRSAVCCLFVSSEVPRLMG